MPRCGASTWAGVNIDGVGCRADSEATRIVVVAPDLDFDEGRLKLETVVAPRISHGHRRIGQSLIDEGRNG